MSHSEHLLLLLMLLLHNAETIVKRVVTLLIRVYHFYGNHMDTKQIAFLAHLKPYILSGQARLYEVVSKTGSDEMIH